MTKKKSGIPTPPGLDAFVEELTAYYEQYSPQALIEAGYMTMLPAHDTRVMRHREIAGALHSLE